MSIEAVSTRLAQIEARRSQVFSENENRFEEIYREKIGKELLSNKEVATEQDNAEGETANDGNASSSFTSQSSGSSLLRSNNGLNSFATSALLSQLTGRQSNMCASCGAWLGSIYQNNNNTATATGQFAGAAPYMNIINACSQKYDVPVNIILGVMKIESGFNNNSTSKAGALGLMQLMPKTAKSLGVSNPLDPAQNIEGGVKYIRKMLDMFDGDMKLALAAYNTGPGNVKKRGAVFQNIPSGVQGYVNKVLKYAGYAA